MAVVDQSPLTASRPITRLLASGWFELIPAAILMALAVVLNFGFDKPKAALLLDGCAFVAAAFTGRYPRVAGALLALCLLAHLAIPPTWATMSEYAPLVPLLGAGVRGLVRRQRVMVIGYGALLAAITAHDAPSLSEALLGCVIWAVLLLLVCFVGYAFNRLDRAHQVERQAALMLQRQRLVRELHDTVARTLMIIAKQGERIIERGGTPEDLEALVATARGAEDQLRMALRFLSDPTSSATQWAPGSSLGEALRTGEALLRQHGFQPTIDVGGEVRLISPQCSSVLGTAAAEAIANVVKHGDPARPVAVAVSLVGDQVELDVLNYAAATTSRDNSWGLQAMGQLLAEAGGTVTTERVDDQWHCRILLPLAATEPKKGRVTAPPPT